MLTDEEIKHRALLWTRDPETDSPEKKGEKMRVFDCLVHRVCDREVKRHAEAIRLINLIIDEILRLKNGEAKPMASRLMKHIDDSGQTVETDALFMDGYTFADRLLEGVPFRLTIKNGELQAECLNKYRKGIDWNYWEQECVRWALQSDVFSTTRELTDSNGFIEP
jgi:hypothetical protein